MLVCAICGFDNLPFTNETISGFARGDSLRLVTHCHQCQARITQKCLVCGHLHPVGARWCSLNGVNISDFVGQKASLSDRLRVFIGSDAVRSLFSGRRRFHYLLAPFSSAVLSLILVFMAWEFVLLAFESPNSVGVAAFVSACLFLVIWVIVFMSGEVYYSRKIRRLWRKFNPEEIEIGFFDGELKYGDLHRFLLAKFKDQTN